MAQTHYLWHDSSGRICGVSPGHYGWGGEDPTDPGVSADTHAYNVRDFMLNGAGMGITGGIDHACACAPGDDACQHAEEGFRDYYVDVGGTGLLTAKAALTILVDGVSHPVHDGTPIQKTPGATVTLKLQAAVPDGTEITLQRAGGAIYGSDPTLTFTSGETNEINLTAPAQGAEGGLYGISKLVCAVIVNLVGWA